MLGLGVEQMGVRYFLATLSGYAAFLLLIRAWIAYRRGLSGENDLASEIVSNIPQGSVDASAADQPASAAFAGGRSGGGGGGAGWGQQSPGTDSTFDLPDADELWPVVLAVACAVAGVCALFYVVWAAPLLLAEVALDAALVGGVYRRLRREDARHWLDSAFRRTWLPALSLSLLLMAAGFSLQWAVPEAQSIGAVVRTLTPQ
jgi:hypothetical protein